MTFSLPWCWRVVLSLRLDSSGKVDRPRAPTWKQRVGLVGSASVRYEQIIENE
jgi:hypothetical protein